MFSSCTLVKEAANNALSTVRSIACEFVFQADMAESVDAPDLKLSEAVFRSFAQLCKNRILLGKTGHFAAKLLHGFALL